MQDFTQKLAVITGAASGVGRSLAFELGAEGARVLLADVDEEALEQTVAELIERNVDARSQHCDVTSLESVEALAATAFDELGGAHVVFSNAGVSAGEAGQIWEISDKDWQWTFDVNFWGAVITTGSGNGAFIVYPEQPVYTATKAALQALTETLHIQMTNQGSPVKIHALFPGPHIVDTGIFNSNRVRPEEFKKDDMSPAMGITSADDMREMMESFGMELVTTHPDEVAATAIQGVKDGQFWIAPLNDGTREKVRARFDSILNRTDLPIPTLG